MSKFNAVQFKNEYEEYRDIYNKRRNWRELDSDENLNDYNIWHYIMRDKWKGHLLENWTAIKTICKLNANRDVIYYISGDRHGPDIPIYIKPIVLAVKYNYIELVNVLVKLENCDVNQVASDHDHAQTNLLFYTTSYDMIKCLIDFGINVNTIYNGRTKLSIHCEKYYKLTSIQNNFEIIKLLLESGADPNLGLVVHNLRITNLMYMCNIGNIELVKLLIKHNANVFEKDIHDRTAYSHATTDIKTLFIEMGYMYASS